MEITHTQAQYHKIEGHLNENILITALPPKQSVQTFKKQMMVTPVYSASKNQASDISVADVVTAFRTLRFVLVEHYQLYEKIYHLIVQGYVDRNPLKPKFIAWQYEVAMGNDKPVEFISEKTTSDTILVTGASGLGKTVTIEWIIWNAFPKVITHALDHFKEPQIIYVKVDMPHDASRSELIHRMLKDIDKTLSAVGYHGTHYAASVELKNGRRVTIAAMVDILRAVLIRHHVGLLIIDEFQNLEVASIRYRNEMIQLFDDLSNTLGIPHLKIGTPNSILLFTQKMRHLRRLGEVYEFSRVTDEKSIKSLLSQMMLELPDQIQLDSPELLKERLIDFSAGVPAVLLGLWESCLKFAVMTKRPITKEVIQSLFNKEFALLKRVLDDIKINKESSLLDLLTVHQLFRKNKTQAIKQFQKFMQDNEPKGVAAQQVLESVLDLENQEEISNEDKQTLKEIKQKLQNSAKENHGPQTLEHDL